MNKFEIMMQKAKELVKEIPVDSVRCDFLEIPIADPTYPIDFYKVVFKKKPWATNLGRFYTWEVDSIG